jgi:hypothetical protein
LSKSSARFASCNDQYLDISRASTLSCYRQITVRLASSENIVVLDRFDISITESAKAAFAVRWLLPLQARGDQAI